MSAIMKSGAGEAQGNTGDYAHVTRGPLAPEPHSDDEAHWTSGAGAHTKRGPSSEPHADGEDQVKPGDIAHRTGVPPSAPNLTPIIDALREVHRQRMLFMENRKSQDLRLGAYLRTALGWSLALPAGERKRIADAAQDILKQGERHVKAVRRAADKAAKRPAGSADQAIIGNDALQDHVPLPAALAPYANIVIPMIESREPIGRAEKAAKDEMERLAQSLPVWPLVCDWRGFGPVSLAIIVAEAGDLGHYPTKGKLYKRLGLAVIDGVAQGKLPSNASKELWIEHGYSRRRRSQIWNSASSPLLKAGNERYRSFYLDRKAYEAARAEAEGLIVAPSAKVPKGKAAQYRTVGHIHNRASRYAEKHIICDLWRAWHLAARELFNV